MGYTEKIKKLLHMAYLNLVNLDVVKCNIRTWLLCEWQLDMIDSDLYCDLLNSLDDIISDFLKQEVY